MNTKEISEKYNISKKDLNNYLFNEREVEFATSILGVVDVYEDPEVVVQKYNEYLVRQQKEKEDLEKKKKEDAEAKVREAQEKIRLEEERSALRQKIQEAKKNMIVTTTAALPGYKIKKYCGIVNAECSAGTGIFSELEMGITDLLGVGSLVLNSKLSNKKDDCLDILSYKAALLGANAIIGVDFDITTLINNTIIVSANGTAVLAENDSNY